ncbi:hypothetical protein SteCoe_19 [Stentor coeruleus]|uniref:Uncharacterized protein n=1 Tax=Stentor coeruleus TaxID=5963 RepID=A0A1R2D4U7_9CILI|nr:hypothetical protein SteCoe_19 [Stentor coeruleus]
MNISTRLKLKRFLQPSNSESISLTPIRVFITKKGNSKLEGKSLSLTNFIAKTQSSKFEALSIGKRKEVTKDAQINKKNSVGKAYERKLKKLNIITIKDIVEVRKINSPILQTCTPSIKKHNYKPDSICIKPETHYPSIHKSAHKKKLNKEKFKQLSSMSFIISAKDILSHSRYSFPDIKFH